MNYRIIIIGIVLSMFVSCIGIKNNQSEMINSTESGCSGPEKNEVIETSTKTYIPVSTYKIQSLIKDSDTVIIDHLVCSDSIRFTEVFEDIKVGHWCIELQVQGNSFYSVKINSIGEFEGFKIIKGVHDCFNDVHEKIKLRLMKIKVLSNEYFDSKLIFYHKFRLN